MKRSDLISEVEQDFNILTDFARVCGMNEDLINCMLRLQLKVRGLYPEPEPVVIVKSEPQPRVTRPPRPPAKPRVRRVRTYRAKTRPERIPQTFEPIHVASNERWG